MSCVKMAKPTNAIWGIDSGGPRKQELDWGAHWHHLVNTIKLPICGSDAAFFVNYFDHLLLHCIACTTYIDTVYCYQPHSVVCLSIGLSVSLSH